MSLSGSFTSPVLERAFSPDLEVALLGSVELATWNSVWRPRMSGLEEKIAYFLE
ncbi:MAG: hypothetical protein R2742_00560 [Micropruina glycogenica]